MVRVKRRTAPVDYRLCSQTVTIYHWDGKEAIARKVIEKGAFLDFKKTQDISKTSNTEVNSFLLVIPCSEVPVAVGDKVLQGEGPELAGRAGLGSFPPKSPGWWWSSMWTRSTGRASWSMWRQVGSMNVVGQIKVNMALVQRIMKGLGVTAQGDVQRFHTANVRRRIQKYMPYRTGSTIKLMIVQSPADEPSIHVDQPFARVQYYGKVMVGPKTHAAGFLTANGWHSRRGVPKVVSSRDIEYDKTKNPQAGPHWDRRLVAAEGAVMQQELQDYINRRAG